MKIIIVLTFTLLLLGCAGTKPATKVEKDNAMHAYQQCALRYASKMDDGVSDAKTIAETVAYYCEKEYKASLETYARSMSSRGKKLFYQGQLTKERRIEVPLTAVLNVRVNKK